MELILDTNNSDKEHFRTFIQDLRTFYLRKFDLLTQNPPPFYTLPLPETIKLEDNFFTVTLVSNERRLVLMIRSDSLYIVAFSVGLNGRWKVFKSKHGSNLSDVTEFLKNKGNEDAEFHRPLGPTEILSDSYVGLERLAKAHRGEFLLGQFQLNQALYCLTNPHDSVKLHAKSLLVVIQMVSEAMRMDGIANRLADYYETGILPGDQMIEFEQNWSNYSKILEKYVDNKKPLPFATKCQTYTFEQLLEYIYIVKSENT